MTLVPVDGLLATIVDAYEREPEGTAEWLRLALIERLEDDITTNGHLVVPVLKELSLDAISDVRRAMVRTYVGKAAGGETPPELSRTAAWLTAIEAVVKADRFDPNEHPRGYHGWFRDVLHGLSRGFKGEKVKPPGELLSPSDFHDKLEAWRGKDSSGADQALNRMALTGQTITALSGNSSAGAQIGMVAQLIGEYGPQASEVLGRDLTRVAYRYRGTERRPDPLLAAQLAALQPKVLEYSTAGDEARAEVGRRFRGSLNQETAIWSNPRVYRDMPGMTDSLDQRVLAIRGDVAANYLLQRGGVPDPHEARIASAAGRMPPSTGLLIDHTGKLASDAMGFASDHYLPFDLANLRRLSGGQYVRTRAFGGPTSEDVYTGLLTGARQLQVVSNNGLFTMEFDPDLRGGRRYNDKALGMVRRYTDILAAIASAKEKKLYEADIPASDKRRFRTEAYRSAYDAESAERIYDSKVDAARMQASVVDEQDMQNMAQERARAELGRGGSVHQYEQRVKDIYDELANDEFASRARTYQLDGPGYLAAMRTLQTEFPFFIRSVRHEDLRKLTQRIGGDTFVPPTRSGRPRGGSDIGYVRRNQLSAHDDKGESKKPSGPTGATGPTGAAGLVGGPTGPTGPSSPAGAGVAVPRGIQVPVGIKAEAGSRSIAEAMVGHRRTLADQLVKPLRALRHMAEQNAREGLGGVPEGGFTPKELADLVATPPAEAAKLEGGAFATWLVRQGSETRQADLLVDNPALMASANKAFVLMHDLRTGSRIQLDDFTNMRLEATPEILETGVRLTGAATDLAEPFSTTATDPVLGDFASRTVEKPKPVAFDQILALGDDVGAYERYLEGVGKGTPLDNAVNYLGPFAHSAESMAAAVRERVNRYQELQAAAVAVLDNMARGGTGHRAGETPDPRLPKDRAELERLASGDPANQLYAPMVTTQLAWSFWTGYNAAMALPGKAPAPDEAGATPEPGTKSGALSGPSPSSEEIGMSAWALAQELAHPSGDGTALLSKLLATGAALAARPPTRSSSTVLRKRSAPRPTTATTRRLTPAPARPTLRQR